MQNSSNGQPTVWVVIPAQWTRALLRGELIERGYDAVGFIDARDALESLAERPPDGIVVELRGLPPAQLERLVKIGVPVIATGGASDLADPSLRSVEFAELLPRPVTLGAIADRVEAVLARDR